MTDEPRLAPGFEASALLRRAELSGGFGAVAVRGDPDRGSLLLILLERGRFHACLGRSLALDGRYRWARLGPDAASADSLPSFLEKRRRSDPDEWQIELDIPSTERFIAETTASG